MAPRLHWNARGGDGMIELVIVIAGTILLIAAGNSRRPEPVPVRTERRKR